MAPLHNVADAPLGHIGLVGVDAALRNDLESQLSRDFTLTSPHEPDYLFDHMESGGAPLDAVVLGLAVDDAVRVAQRVHSYDKLIPILILSPPLMQEELKRTLMFSPFLGNEVTVWPTGDEDVLPALLREAVDRHRQRQIHRNTLSTAQIKLEKFPLQQPEASHYLDRLLDHAPVGVVTVNLEGTISTVNRGAKNILAPDGRHVLGQPLARFFSSSEQQRLSALRHTCRDQGGENNRDVLELGADDGQSRYVEITIAPLAYRTGQRGFMLILQDVTSRIEAEKERQRAEDDLRHHAVLLRRFHGITSSESLSLEEKMDEVLRLGCEQFQLPTGILSRVDGEDLSVVRAVGGDADYAVGSSHRLEQTYCAISLRSPEPLVMAQAEQDAWRHHPAYLSSGHRSYIGTFVAVDGHMHGTLCFFSRSPRARDFNSADSELIKLMSRWVGSELQRERANALMRTLSGALERTADSIMITDRNRFIEYVNPAFETLTGYHKDEVVGQKSYFLRSGLHDRGFYDELWDVIGKGDVYRGTIVNRKKDGTLYHEQKTISPLKDENGVITHFISNGHDITELIEAEERNREHQAELAHVARLSTLGEMTSGLAHELNQPLCAITSYAETCLHILQNEDRAPERVQYGLQQVVKQAKLASAIFSRLRNFARKGEIRREPIDMPRIAREVMDFVTTEAHQKLVKLHRDVPKDLGEVLGDPIQIEQVLLNLVRNAMDAVAPLPESRRHITLSASGEEDGSITLEIHDLGEGCPAEIADHLFDPFVTTKPQGLGIGLSISQNIVEAHGGHLWLAENTPEGAVFRFTLPTGLDADEDDE